MRNITLWLCILVSIHTYGQDTLKVVIEEMNIIDETTIQVPVKINGVREIAGYQFSIVWDSSIFSLDTISDFGLPRMAYGNFGITRIEQGILSASWSYASQGNYKLESDTLFSLTFKVESTCDIRFSLDLISKPLDPIAFRYSKGRIDHIPLSEAFSELINPLKIFDNDVIKNISGCPDDTITLHTYNYSPEISYQWTTENNNIIASSSDTIRLHLSKSDTAYLISTGKCYRTDTFQTVIEVFESNTGVYDADTIYADVPLVFEAFGGISYKWYAESSTLENAMTEKCTVIPKRSDRIWVDIVDTHGCTSTHSVNVSIEKAKFQLYNAISPNGDGNNDVLYFDGIPDDAMMQLTVFNRWGTIVYHNENYAQDWGGTDTKGEPLPAGSYVYVLKYTDQVHQSPLIILYD